MSEFKVGDRVRCIAAEGVDVVELGHEYTVTEGTKGDGIVRVDAGQCSVALYARRFELVSRAEKAPEFCGDVDVGTCIAVCECGKHRQADRPHAYSADAHRRSMTRVEGQGAKPTPVVVHVNGRPVDSLSASAQRIFEDACEAAGRVNHGVWRDHTYRGDDLTEEIAIIQHEPARHTTVRANHTVDFVAVNGRRWISPKEFEEERQRANRLGDECGSLRSDLRLEQDNAGRLARQNADLESDLRVARRRIKALEEQVFHAQAGVSVSDLDYTTRLICDQIHRRAKDLGYSDACIKRASEKALDMRPTGKGLAILPGTHPKSIAVWAEMLLDEAARGR